MIITEELSDTISDSLLQYSMWELKNNKEQCYVMTMNDKVVPIIFLLKYNISFENGNFAPI